MVRALRRRTIRFRVWIAKRIAAFGVGLANAFLPGVGFANQARRSGRPFSAKRNAKESLDEMTQSQWLAVGMIRLGDAIAASIRKMRITGPDGKDLDPQHSLYQLLKVKPNRFQTPIQLWKMWSCSSTAKTR